MCTDSCQLPRPSPVFYRDAYMHLHVCMSTHRHTDMHTISLETRTVKEEQVFLAWVLSAFYPFSLHCSFLFHMNSLYFSFSLFLSVSMSLFPSSLSPSQCRGYRAPATREMSDLVIVQLAAQAWGPVQQ